MSCGPRRAKKCRWRPVIPDPVRKFAAALLVVAGCCPEESSTPAASAALGELAWKVILDPAVPSWEAQEIDDAISDWEASVTCRRVTHTTVRAPIGTADAPMSGPFTIEIGPAAKVPGAYEVGATGWGKWTPEGSRFLYEPGDSENDQWDFPRLARHEIGHAFDLPHPEADDELMSFGTRPARYITKADVEAFAKRWCR